jgi:phenylalanyl-tRNA synthetase beta chain
MVSHALIGPDDLARSGYAADAPDLVRLFNPLSEEHAILRPVMYPSLLAGVAENQRMRRRAVRLFDLGTVYWYNPGAPSPRDRRAQTAGTGRYESWELGIVLSGDVDVADMKGIVDALHDALGAPRPAYRAEVADARHPHRHPGRTGLVCDTAGRPYGSLGEVHPGVVEAWGMTGRVVDAGIDVGRLLDLVPAVQRSVPVPAAQPVDRDLAVVVDETTPVGEVLRVARMSAGPLLADLELFDTYRGEQVGAGRVSYALAFRFQPETAGDVSGVEKALSKVRGSLQHHLDAEIR